MLYTNLVVKQLYTDVQLLNSLFQKAYGRGIYCVTAHKLILNVSKIRLRLICACASYLRRLFQKAYGKGASALSLHKKQSSTYSKYACGCFLCAPSICIVYFKRLTEEVHLLRDAQQSMLNVAELARMPLVPISNVFALQTRSLKMYMDVHFWARILASLLYRVIQF